MTAQAKRLLEILGVLTLLLVIDLLAWGAIVYVGLALYQWGMR